MPEGGGGMAPQFLADQLTLFQPGVEQIMYAHHYRPLQIFWGCGVSADV